jgi:UDPglucose 6-dehydrogenase
MKIGIIGLGVVGSACKAGFERIGHDVKCHDIKLYTNIEDVLDTEVCFVSVPTPSDENGSCNTSIVQKVVKELSDFNYKGIVAIKSTVEPGTTDMLKNKIDNLTLCFVPEFLKERCATEDFIYNNSLLLVGTDSDEVYEKIKETHGNLPVHKIKSSIELHLQILFIKFVKN